MTEMNVLLDDEEVARLARLAREAHMTEQQLVQQFVEGLLQNGRNSVVPRYARRLGPLVLPPS